MPAYPPTPRRRPPGSPFKDRVPAPVEDYSIDDRVSHDTYGMGRIVNIGNDSSVLVDFGGRQELIPVPYPKLHKL